MAKTEPEKPFFESSGKILGLIATIVGIVGGVYTIHDRETRPDLELEMLKPYTGWEVSLRNTGATTAKQIRVGVVAWRNRGRPPAPDVRKSYAVSDLAAGSDVAVNIEVVADSEDPEYRAYREGLSTSGYIVATCESCTSPRAWGFYIPGSGDTSKFEKLFPRSARHWPIAEFPYPDGGPCFYDCVDFPSGVCTGERATSWSPEKGSTNHDCVRPAPPALEAR